MQLKLADITSHLKSELRPVYLVAGDETLLVEETCDAVIKAARQQGFTERSVHHAEGSFKWAEIIHDAASISLFAERKIIDLRVPNGKIDKNASEVIREWLDNNDGDNLLLIRTPRLVKRQRNSAWFKAIDSVGVITLIWDLEARELPRWVSQRMQASGITAEQDAIVYLCERVEGNLLAAQQEIHKLALQELPMPLSLDDLITCLEDSSRYTPFDLVDAVFASNTKRVATIFAGLRSEGVAIMSILMPFASQLRRLDVTQGLPPQRRRVIEQFRRKLPDATPALAECAVVDQQIKGQLPGDPWVTLESLLLRLAGLRQLP